ncbi:MAG: putative Zn finger-like uncharacterized protein [Oceanicoccus sp.]|jgi:predicted Zn finger-like uncharacterized protein
MTNRVTRCPKCMTSFRVTEVQLNIADGAVRCGSCLHIFHAPGHWLDDDVNRETIANNDVAVNGGSTSLTTVLTQANTSDDDKIFTDTSEQPAFEESIDSDVRDFESALDDFGDDVEFAHIGEKNALEEDGKEIFDVKNDLELPRETASSEEPVDSPEESTFDEDMLEQAMSGVGLFDDGEFDDIIFEDDESIQDQLAEGTFGIKDVDIDDSTHEYQSDKNLYSGTFSGLEAPKIHSASNVSQQSHEIVDNGEETFENRAKTQLNRLEDDSHESVTIERFPDIDGDLSDDRNPPPHSEDTRNEHEGANFTAPSAAQKEDDIQGESIVAGDRIGNDTNPLLSNIEPEPVEIASQKTGNRWIHRGWIASIILALTVLIAQYIFFNFDRFSRDESLRPLLTSMCNFAGCSVTRLSNIRLIKSSNLVIRSHPKTAKALIVDAIITNRANFAQDFPIIELQFTDLNENIIASRRFSPEEYVRGELTGNNILPSKQPIYISLEIVDPGLEAVSYQLLIHAF